MQPKMPAKNIQLKILKKKNNKKSKVRMINVHLITLHQTAALFILMFLHQLTQKEKTKIVLESKFCGRNDE